MVKNFDIYKSLRILLTLITPVILKSITLKNYRNYRSQSIVFHPRFNTIHGNNAEGKTNLVEAIYLLCNFRPFKQIKNEEMINFEVESAAVKGEIEADNGLNEVHITIKKDGRHTRLNGKIVYSISKYLGMFKVVLFLPSDIEIVKGSMQTRRKYLDSVISTIDSSYLENLRDYHKALSQRNFLLSSKKPVSQVSFEIWDEKIAEYGAEVVKKRLEIIDIFNQKLEEVYKAGKESDRYVKINYRFSFSENRGLEAGIIESLNKKFAHDKRRGHTTIGPHRDTINLDINGMDASRFASQGQSKNLVLALKASEIKIISELTGVNPILLLDDITSELDMKRKNFLFNILLDFKGQIFVTSTTDDQVPYKGDHKSILIKAGAANIK